LIGPDRGPSGEHVVLNHVELKAPMSGAELAREYAAAAIFAAPAYYEPFGLSILEAAVAGCALVLGDIPSLREVWGDAACYVPPADDVALALALQRLSEDVRQRSAFGYWARQRALHYRAAVTTRHYLNLYRTLQCGKQSV